MRLVLWKNRGSVLLTQGHRSFCHHGKEHSRRLFLVASSRSEAATMTTRSATTKTTAINVQYVISPPTVPTVAVSGSTSLFPVHRIYCVGRNYREHALEMGGDPDREPPFFFSKPADAVVQCGVSEQEQEEQTKSPILTEIPYPSHTNDLHHEVELVVALGKDVDTGSDDPEHLFDCVYGYTVGVDLTRRDLQAEAKKKGRPWCSSKGFDSSAPVGTLHPVSTISPSTSIWLDVNGQRRQNSNLQQMTWSVPEIIAHLSKQFLLKAGDLIFTGTPGGVSALRPGDVVIAGIDGVGQLAFRITERKLELVTS